MLATKPLAQWLRAEVSNSDCALASSGVLDGRCLSGLQFIRLLVQIRGDFRTAARGQEPGREKVQTDMERAARTSSRTACIKGRRSSDGANVNLMEQNVIVGYRKRIKGAAGSLRRSCDEGSDGW